MEIKIQDRSYSIDAFTKQIMVIPPKQLTNILLNYEVAFEKSIRMDAMREALRPNIVKTRNECLTLDSRLNYRLLWFNLFSEYQMEFFLEKFNDAKINTQFSKLLYKSIIETLAKNDLPEELFIELEKNISEYTLKLGSSKGKEILNIKDFNADFNPIFIDLVDELDGLNVKELRPILYNSATKEQIYQLGVKYDIDCPIALNRKTIAKYVIETLDKWGVKHKSSILELDNMSIKNVKAFAANNGLIVGNELTKMQMIEYILQNATTTKDSYTKPTNDSVYEMGIPLTDAETKYDELILETNKLREELDDKKALLDSLQNDSVAYEKALAEISNREKEIDAKEKALQSAKDELSTQSCQPCDNSEEFEAMKLKLEDISKYCLLLEKQLEAERNKSNEVSSTSGADSTDSISTPVVHEMSVKTITESEDMEDSNKRQVIQKQKGNGFLVIFSVLIFALLVTFITYGLLLFLKFYGV